jgi:hypothetical protein
MYSKKNTMKSIKVTESEVVNPHDIEDHFNDEAIDNSF